MAYKFCPYCKCLMRDDGSCRNTTCILGNKAGATGPQIVLIYDLCEELEISLEGKDPNKLTKEKASKLIKKLIAKKAVAETYESEDWE